LAWLGRGAPARTSKPKFRIDAALELIGQEPPPRDSIALARLATTRLGKDVFEFQRASYQIEGGRTILSDLDWLVGPGDRVGILGANGVGKTTLAMMTIGALEASSGRVRLGKTVRPAILSQSLGELSERSADRVFELLAREKLTFLSEAGEVGIGQVLEQLGFDSEALQTRVGELSGGQRRRLQLIRLLFGEPNLLVLDEPTNDFDTDMLTALEDLLDSWPGTLLVISHDRYFIERVTDTQYALLGDGKLRHLPRGVDEYLELKSRAGQRDSMVSRSAGFGPAKDLGKQALSGGERRELEKLLSRLERSVGKLTDEIAEVDAKLLTAPGSDYELLQQLAEERARLSAQLVDAEREWVQTAELLEA
jgi:ATPase subunit of ABC transporter with duplicated ATPase domains